MSAPSDEPEVAMVTITRCDVHFADGRVRAGELLSNEEGVAKVKFDDNGKEEIVTLGTPHPSIENETEVDVPAPEEE